MKNLLLPVRYLLMLVTVMLLGVVAPSMAFADPNNNHNNSNNTVTSAASNNTPESAVTIDQQQQQQTQQTKAKPKTVTKPREKSILDSQSENSPINYLKKAFTSDEDSTPGLPSGTGGTVTQAVKVLVAAALSTIM